MGDGDAEQGPTRGPLLHYVEAFGVGTLLVRANAHQALDTHACLRPKLGFCAIDLCCNEHQRVRGQLTISLRRLSCAQLLAKGALAQPRREARPGWLAPIESSVGGELCERPPGDGHTDVGFTPVMCAIKAALPVEEQRP